MPLSETPDQLSAFDLSRLLSQPEGPTLEFKSRVPRPDILARLIAGFANTTGGIIVIGVDERTGGLGSIDPMEVQRSLQRARELIDGGVQIHVSHPEHQGARLAVIEVRGADGLVAAGGAYYRRFGEATQLMSAADVKAAVTSHGSSQGSLDELARAVSAQSGVIEQMRQDLEKANSLVRKVVIAGLGAIAGAFGRRIVDLVLAAFG